MRTTLDIEDDVLAAVKDLAEQRKTTAGRVLSELARRALTEPGEVREYRGGFRLLPRTGTVITTELVDRWLEEDV